MPTYEYKCLLKGHRFTQSRAITDRSKRVRCHCGDRAVLQVSAPAVIFKGSGFYSTDNRTPPGDSLDAADE